MASKRRPFQSLVSGRASFRNKFESTLTQAVAGLPYGRERQAAAWATLPASYRELKAHMAACNGETFDPETGETSVLCVERRNAKDNVELEFDPCYWRARARRGDEGARKYCLGHGIPFTLDDVAFFRWRCENWPEKQPDLTGRYDLVESVAEGADSEDYSD